MHPVAEHMQEAVALEERQRLARYKRAWARYDGDFPRPLVQKRGQPDHNLIVNLAALIVDTGASFLFEKEVTFELDRSADAEPSADEVWLRNAWIANRKQTFLHKLAINGGVCGHVFVKLQRPSAGSVFPRLVNLDPAIVRPTWDPHDIERLARVEICFPGIRPSDGKAVTYRQTIVPDGGGWFITDEEQVVGLRLWVVTNTERWPWAICPVLHCQNMAKPNEFWGKADLEKDVTDLNEALNFLLSNLSRIIYFHAHPKTVAKGLTNSNQLDTSVENVIGIPANGDLYNLEMQSDLSSSLELYKKVKEALHEIAQLPEVATGKVEDIGQLSGLALKILYGPLLTRTGVKRTLYGDLLTEINRGMLLLGGKPIEQLPRNMWPEALPSDPKADADLLLVDKQLGASEDTLLRKRQYDPQQERAKRKAERADLGDHLLTAFDRGQHEPSA